MVMDVHKNHACAIAFQIFILAKNGSANGGNMVIVGLDC
jgi:hypothetical protein